VSWLLLQALSTASGLHEDVSLGLVPEDELITGAKEHDDPLSRLLSGEVNSVLVETDGQMAVDAKVGGALLPGSFSPFHDGHRELARIAGEMLGSEVFFEISVVNVDKPPLAKEEVERRLVQFLGQNRVVLTRAETFRKKAGLFPGIAFVIGWDTAVRLVAPRYYGGETSAMLTALAEMWATGCRFLVAGREDNGAFYTLDEVDVPHGFSPLFQEIPESRFRNDISSTALRGER
jgi:nicotinic acid mononucleotide adenylyltransferase